MARHYAESYAGKDQRRAMEEADGAMAPSGQGAFANMPQEVVMKAYPAVHGWMPESLNDGIGGIDEQIRANNSMKNSQMAPKKI